MATDSRAYGPMCISGGRVLNGDYNVTNITTFDAEWLEETLRKLIQDQLETRSLQSLPTGNPLVAIALEQSTDVFDPGYLLERYFKTLESSRRPASDATTPSMQVSSLRSGSNSDGASFLSAAEYLPRTKGVTRGTLPLTTQTQIFVKGVPGMRSLLILVDLDDRIMKIENKLRGDTVVPNFDFRFSYHGRRLDEFDTVRDVGLKALSTLTCCPVMVKSLPPIELGPWDDDDEWIPISKKEDMNQQSWPLPHVNAQETPARWKKKHRKTRTGCVTCKDRRVKCNGKKPICDRCNAHGRQCS